MKTIALSSILLLLAACASPTAVIENTFDCRPGQDLEIRAGLSDPLRSGEQVGQYMFLVEVANNSDNDLTVQTVRVQPREDQGRVRRRGMALQSAAKEFNQTIPEGTEHVFELPATAFGVMRELQDQISREPIEFVVTVDLTNGDSYRCPFAAGSR
jgi:hypothetical protein